MITYKDLVNETLYSGTKQVSRNGVTLAVFGRSLTYDLTIGFPIVTGRKIFYKGVIGELAALLKGPQHIDDFKKYECNYWDKFADDNGEIRLAYGNAWRDFNGVDQLSRLVRGLEQEPGGRRHLVTAWDPSDLDRLSSQCCHYAYQWFVDGQHLDMIWIQRSVDLMVGLPSDIILGAALNMVVASHVGLQPRHVTYQLGNCHIYDEHGAQAEEYLKAPIYYLPTATVSPIATLDNFHPSMFELKNYEHSPKINFNLKL